MGHGVFYLLGYGHVCSVMIVGQFGCGRRFVNEFVAHNEDFFLLDNCVMARDKNSILPDGQTPVRCRAGRMAGLLESDCGKQKQSGNRLVSRDPVMENMTRPTCNGLAVSGLHTRTQRIPGFGPGR